MKMVIFSALLALSVLASGCREQDVAYDMARFDRAYVPALMLTSTRDTTGSSVLAVKRLKQDWSVLSAKYQQVFAVEGAADRIEGLLDRADMLITTGDFQRAHAELEKIRVVLRDTRKRHGIDYFMDYLTEFHSVMEEIASVAAAGGQSGLTDSDVKDISRLLPVARDRWKALEGAPFDRDSFLFDKQTEQALRDAMAEEARAIYNLEAAVRSGNSNLIAKHAVLLKQGYARVLRMFGNFESVSI